MIGEETLSSTSAFNLRHSEVLSATTKAVIVKSFRPRYLAISEANRTLALATRNIKSMGNLALTPAPIPPLSDSVDMPSA